MDISLDIRRRGDLHVIPWGIKCAHLERDFACVCEVHPTDRGSGGRINSQLCDASEFNGTEDAAGHNARKGQGRDGKHPFENARDVWRKDQSAHYNRQDDSSTDEASRYIKTC